MYFLSYPMRIMLLFVVLACFLRTTSPVYGQQPAPKPTPHAPVLGPLHPTGGQRGKNIEVELTGKNLSEPTGVLTSFPCKVSIPREDKNGTNATKLKIRLEVPADAPVGYQSLRLATAAGISNFRIFCIDDLPQILEKGPNQTRNTGQAVSLPCVVVGQVDNEKTDFFKFKAKAGQRVSIEVLGRRLGSLLDPVITLYEMGTGRELEHASDSPGLQTDARLTYQIQKEGEFLVEVKDILNRGGAEYWYRLRLGDFPCATASIPLAGKRGEKINVRFIGPSVKDVLPQQVVVPTSAVITSLWLSPQGKNRLGGWPVPFLVSDLHETVEKEPNGDRSKAQPLVVPARVSGTFPKYGDVDFYSLELKKGQSIAIQAETREIYSPTLVYLTVGDSAGKELAKSNPEANPPAHQHIDFTAPQDGQYFLRVEHLNYLGGPSEFYRLHIDPAQAGFQVSSALDRWDLAPGESKIIPLQVKRQGYAGPIEIKAISSNPGLAGSVTVAANSQTGNLVLKADRNLQAGPYLIQLLSYAKVGNRLHQELVNVEDAVSAELGKLPYPPVHLNTRIAVAIRPRPPFLLSARFDPPEAVPGLPATVILTAKREKGHNEPITLLAPEGLPANIKLPALPTIPKDKSEVKFTFPIDAKTGLGNLLLQFSAKTKSPQGDRYASSDPVTMAVTRPFSLKVAKGDYSLKPGAKMKIRIEATRKGGYQGPIKVQVRNLPGNVTAPEGTIAMGQKAVEIEISAAANATGMRNDVNVLGTALAAGNQQEGSANFAIRVIR